MYIYIYIYIFNQHKTNPTHKKAHISPHAYMCSMYSYGICMEPSLSDLGLTLIYTSTHVCMCYIYSYSRVYVFHI